MKSCNGCGYGMNDNDKKCPQCGAEVHKAVEKDYYGYEYKSKANIMGWPLLHISFRFNTKGSGIFRIGRTRYGGPVPARGVIAIGQFAVGVVTISQFGVGVFSLSQFTIAGYAVAQIAIAYDLIAQVGAYFNSGWGQIVFSFSELMKMLNF